MNPIYMLQHQDIPLTECEPKREVTEVCVQNAPILYEVKRGKIKNMPFGQVGIKLQRRHEGDKSKIQYNI